MNNNNTIEKRSNLMQPRTGKDSLKEFQQVQILCPYSILILQPWIPECMGRVCVIHACLPHQIPLGLDTRNCLIDQRLKVGGEPIQIDLFLFISSDEFKFEHASGTLIECILICQSILDQ